MGMGKKSGKKMRGPVVALAMVALCAGLWMTVGCGGSTKGSQETGSGQTTPENAGDTSQNQNANQNTNQNTDGGQNTDQSSISGGNTDFSLNDQQIGGAYVPDPRIVDIRWADHGDYYRIVFEFENQDGSEVTTVPKTHTWYFKPDYGIAIAFDNFATYKYDYSEFTQGGVPVDLGDALVKTMFRWNTADGEPVTFEVDCEHSDAHPGVSARPHRLVYQTGPMRVILDIQKM